MTAFVQGTVFVSGTFDFEAADFVVLRITEVALFAAAYCLSVDRLADSISAAQDGSVTRIAAFGLPVAGFQATLALGALLVVTTTDFLDADAVGAHLAADTLGVIRAGWTAFAFDTLLRWQTVAAALASRDANTAGTRLRCRTLSLRGAQDQ